MFDRDHKAEQRHTQRQAHDIGTDPATVRELMHGSSDAPERLKRMLRVCGFAPEAVLGNRRLGRDLERVCSSCDVRARCGRWLNRAERRADATRFEVPGFCPNRGTFAEIRKLGMDRARR